MDVADGLGLGQRQDVVIAFQRMVMLPVTLAAKVFL